MRQILWFRRDLRINDNAILSNAFDEVLPIFIFDEKILSALNKDDKRVTFIYESVLALKKQLIQKGLDLAIFYGNPKEIFVKLQKEGFDEVLCSVDFDYYSKKRDKEIEEILPMKRFSDSWILKPWEVYKKDGTPYKMFTPFYKSLDFLWQSKSLEEFSFNENLKLIDFDYSCNISLEDMGFKKEVLPEFLKKDAKELIEKFSESLNSYVNNRDFFNKQSTSMLSVHLRFGLVSARELFNKIKVLNTNECDAYIRQLFWREFYNYILYHFPKSQFENFKKLTVPWNENEDDFIAWCEGNTGVPIIDASMREFNKTGMMHNRLRMIVSSYLTKNLLIDWRKGERYFASKLLDYEASSNIGSWQWAASTGVDSVPYFRIFNPYLQSLKFDKEALFIKSVIKEFENIDARVLHKEGAVQENLFVDYPKQIVSISYSRQRAIDTFRRLQNEKD